jgi:eukaryotic-like serine/threonine-protein kinase
MGARRISIGILAGMVAHAQDPFPPASSEPPPSSAVAPVRSGSVPPSLAAGMIVGRKYELVRRIGAGAMGEVWAARHATLDEEVAIKLVMRNVDHEDGTSAESRFLLEARVAASLSRKTRHIVSVTDHGTDGALAYLVMELLEGESLDARIERKGTLPLEKAVPIVAQIARGLAAAHTEGVVHRDLKPSNVFVTVDEEGQAIAKILDFGIAKLRRSPGLAAAHATMRGFLLGTPAYMSPEQARGRANTIDHRADVWALAVIAYELLTGELPFEGETPEDLFARLCRIEPVPIQLRRPDLPAVVGDFFVRAFSPRMSDRFQSAAALAGAFEQLEPLSKTAALSLPPPATRAASHEPVRGMDAPAQRSVEAPSTLETSIVAAGVPGKRRWLPVALSAVLVSAVLAGTATLLSVHFEREPAPPASGLAAGATLMDPTGRADEIPPPPPAAGARELPGSVTAGDLPEARLERPSRAGPRASSSGFERRAPEAAAFGAATTAVAQEPAPSAAPAVVPAEAPRTVDRSEIF